MNCKRRLEDHLRENAVPYQTHHHPRAITAQEVAATEHVPGRMFAKTVMVSTDGGDMCMLALPAPYHVNLEKAAAALGAREAHIAEEGRFAETFPDCEVGAMPPSGTSTASPCAWTRPWQRTRRWCSGPAPTPTP